MSLSPYPEVCLCQIFSPTDEKHKTSHLEKYANSLYKSLHFSVGTIPICSKSIADAILDLANQERSDVIMLGASREGILQQVMHGNIPEAIAKNSNRTIIIFRKAM
jgi:CIC family chloride channel protein